MSNQASFFRKKGIPTADLIPAERGEVRTFTGDGSQELEVPGLLKCTYVNVGGAEQPSEYIHDYPSGVNGEGLIPAREVHASWEIESEDGRTVLLRHQQFNYGIWQQGAQILVAGEWDPAIPATHEDPSKIELSVKGVAGLDANSLLQMIISQQQDDVATGAAAASAAAAMAAAAEQSVEKEADKKDGKSK